MIHMVHLILLRCEWMQWSSLNSMWMRANKCITLRFNSQTLCHLSVYFDAFVQKNRETERYLSILLLILSLPKFKFASWLWATSEFILCDSDFLVFDLIEHKWKWKFSCCIELSFGYNKLNLLKTSNSAENVLDLFNMKCKRFVDSNKMSYGKRTVNNIFEIVIFHIET